MLGSYVDKSNKSHMFLLSEGEFTTIDVPGAVQTGTMGISSGINPEGEIVGGYVGTDSRIHGFLLEENGFSTFSFPNSPLTNTRSINPRGDIVGFWREVPASGGFKDHGFLLQR